MADIKNPKLNQNIKELRNKLKMTQQEFADKFDVNRGVVAKIEVEEINVTDRNIKAICNTFNVNEEWLRSGKGEIFNQYFEEGELQYLVTSLDAKNDEFKIKFIKFMLRQPNENWDMIEKMITEFNTYLNKK